MSRLLRRLAKQRLPFSKRVGPKLAPAPYPALLPPSKTPSKFTYLAKAHGLQGGRVGNNCKNFMQYSIAVKITQKYLNLKEFCQISTKFISLPLFSLLTRLECQYLPFGLFGLLTQNFFQEPKPAAEAAFVSRFTAPWCIMALARCTFRETDL